MRSKTEANTIVRTFARIGTLGLNEHETERTAIAIARSIVIAASASDEVSTEFEHAAVVFTEATRQHTAITEIQSLARDLVVTEATRRDVMHAVRERTQACEDALTNATLHLFGLVNA